MSHANFKDNAGSLFELIEVRRLADEATIEASLRLRYDVWSGQGVTLTSPDSGVITDAHDDHAMHWGVFDGEQLVASARLCVHSVLIQAPDGELFAQLPIPVPVASMNRLVVSRSHRGRGIAKLLDEVRILKSQQLGVFAIIATTILFHQSRRRSLEAKGFRFVPDRITNTVWSSSVEICPYYLELRANEIKLQ